MDKKISQLRKRIDKLDTTIIENLEKRLHTVDEIREIKKNKKIPLITLKREKEVTRKLKRLSKINPKTLTNIYKEIFAYSKRK